MTVTGLGDPFTLTPTSGDESRHASVNTKIRMLGVAADEQGVKNVTVTGALTVSCSGGELGQAVSVHYIANNPEDPEIGVGDEAKDRRITLLELDTANLKSFCGANFSFSGASGSFVTIGENFHGGTATTDAFALTVP